MTEDARKVCVSAFSDNSDRISQQTVHYPIFTIENDYTGLFTFSNTCLCTFSSTSPSLVVHAHP